MTMFVQFTMLGGTPVMVRPEAVLAFHSAVRNVGGAIHPVTALVIANSDSILVTDTSEDVYNFLRGDG